MNTATTSRIAAVLIDYQNLYYFLKNHLEYPAQPGDSAAGMVENLRTHLQSNGIRLSSGFAYADFAGLDEHIRHVQRALYLNGIQPFYVPSTMHRNTTDLQLAIDALHICNSDPDVNCFVMVSGDRDYAPVVKALQAAGKQVMMVSFRDHLSSYLLDNTGAGEYLNAATLLDEDARELLTQEDEIRTPDAKTEFNEPTDPPYDIDMEALEVIERFFGQYDEVYLTPLLRKLSEEMGESEDHDPKSLIGDLEECGAVRLERRRGMPYDYTVLIVNAEHPAVIEIKEELGDLDRDLYSSDEDSFDGTSFESEYDDYEYESEHEVVETASEV
ncbi:MAG: NYN domain-containing protein [Rubricoccaceae bacterium]|nr:NYN domain-containing protein [Rubricoccaceae bacterium]